MMRVVAPVAIPLASPARQVRLQRAEIFDLYASFAGASRYFEAAAEDSATGNSVVVLGGGLFCANFAGGISVPEG